MNSQSSIPRVKGMPLLGNLLRIKEDPLTALIEWRDQYGDLLAFQLGPQKLYLLSHPRLVEEALLEQPDVFVKMYNPNKPRGLELVLGQGLLTSRGDLWRRQRGLLQPVFQRRNIAELYPQMSVVGERWLTRWRALPDQTMLDIPDEMMRLTLEVLTQTMFSTSVMDRVEDIAPALSSCLRYAAKTAMNPFTPPLYIPTAENRAFKQSLATLDQIIYRLISERRDNPDQQDDLLSLLLKAGDPESGEGMSDRQLRDEMITIFTAGHETTANVLTWTLYFLATHPEWQSRLREEARGVLNGRAAAFDELEQLPVCKAVLQETMRLRPPAGFLMRKVDCDTQLEGYTLKANALAVMSIYNIHHHPDLWERPEVFDPNRFIGVKQAKSTFMPFGLGSRYCIGNHFAMIEMMLMMSLLLQHFEFSYDGPPVDMEMAVTIRPKGGLQLRVSAL